MIRNFKNKKRKIVYITGSMITALYLTAINIHADNAGDKMTSVFTKGGESAKALGNTIGGVIAGCISFICGIAALIITIKGGYKSWQNRGVESVFEESGTAIGVLAIVAVFAGIVSAVFFNV